MVARLGISCAVILSLLLSVSHDVSASSGGWHWLNPLPDGQYVSAVACAPHGPCYAVGGNGVVLVTRDQGRSWTSVSSVRKLDLFAVACPASTTCYAAANSGGAILHTTNGGRSWSVRFLNPTWAFFRLSCPATQTCYAVGNDVTYECHVPECNLHGKENVVVRTTDGGQTWQRLDTGDTDSLSSIACPIARTCYVVGGSGTVLVTGDSGKTWRREARTVADPHVSLTSVACVSTKACLIGGDGVLLATKSYGATWTRVPAPNGIHFGFSGLTCATETVCLGVGSSWPPNHELYSKVVVMILLGRATVQATARGAVEGQSIACSNVTHCVVAGGSDSPSTTSDGGRQWRNRVHGDREELDQIVCPTSLSCRAVGKGRIVATDNGGASWQSRGPAVGDDYGNGSGLACPTAQVCYAGRSFGRILKSTDGGRSWHTERNPANGTAIEVSSISCPSATVCFAAGSGCRQDPCKQGEQASSVVLRTVNGGGRWRELYRQQGQFLHVSSMSCPSTSVCYLVGSPAFMITTRDGGRTWHNRSTSAAGTSVAFASVSCASTTTCAIVGSGCVGGFSCGPSGFGGVLLTTTNSGQSWRERIPALSAGDRSKTCDLSGCPAGVTLNAVTCPTTQQCWAVGALGSIYHTANSGASWTLEPSGTEINLRGVECVGTSRCYAVGEGGVILGFSNA